MIVMPTPWIVPAVPSPRTIPTVPSPRTIPAVPSPRIVPRAPSPWVIPTVPSPSAVPTPIVPSIPVGIAPTAEHCGHIFWLDPNLIAHNDQVIECRIVSRGIEIIWIRPV